MDWSNHVWLITYFTEYLKSQLSFPYVINTQEIIGLPYPIFYGTLFYPLVSLIAVFVGARWAACLIVLGLHLWQFYLTYKLILSAKIDKKISYVLSFIVMAAVYPLTNILTRGALTEYVATGLLHVFICLFLMWSLNWSPQDRKKYFWQLSLVFALIIGTHPITALFGGVFLFIMTGLFIFYIKDKKRYLLNLIGIGVISVAVASSWLYSYLLLKKELFVSYWDKLPVRERLFDTFVNRFSLIPSDPRTINVSSEELAKIDNPYLDAQINIPLLIACLLLVILLLKRKVIINKLGRVLIVFGSICFILLSTLSVNPDWWDSAPTFLKVIQFMYRLISYVNLSLLVTMFGALILLHRAEFNNKIWTKILIIPLALTLLNIGIKISHSIYVLNHWEVVETRDPLQLPKSFYGIMNYSSYLVHPDFVPDPKKPNAQLKFIVTDHPFGDVLSVDADIKLPTSLLTNVQLFRWNRLTKNNEYIDNDQIGYYNSFQATVLPVGSYQLGYKFQIDPWLRFFRYFGVMIFIINVGMIIQSYRKLETT